MGCKRKHFFRILFVGFFGNCYSPLPVLGQRPNIIFIMTDDMGYADLSGYGRKDYQTPNLDKLATQGMKFPQAYAAAPICTPTRTAFMTGRYPARTPVGLIEPLTGASDSAVGLTTAYPSLPALLHKAGYETAMIGKWHLGKQLQHSPTSNGFDYFFGIKSGGADYVSHRGLNRTANDLFENDSPVYAKGYLTDLFSQRAAKYISGKHARPFFLALTYNAPHWPWQGPADQPYPDSLGFTMGGSAATYAAMMKSLDDGIGLLMRAIEQAGIGAKTLVIFTNDNGGERFSDNNGFAKSKGNVWEGGIRVPAFVRWPGKIKAGTVTQQVAVTMDWTATILGAAKARADKNFALDGVDLMPILKGQKDNLPRQLFWRVTQRMQQYALRDGDWKYLKDEKGEYLFNLRDDPSEKNNLKLSDSTLFNRLKSIYANWEKTMLQPVPLPAGERAK